MLRILSVGVLALALPLAALAGTVVESFKGDVQAGGAAVKQGQRLVSPTAITTGPGAQVFLKFDDAMQIVLGENSLLRMVDFRYTPSTATDRGVFELLRGSARVVTGKIAANNPSQFFFRMPQTQLTIQQPADFTVALVNPAYIAVKSGTVLSSNGWGSVPLGAGSTTGIAGNAVAPAAMSASAFPASAASAISNLSVAAVSAPVGGSAAGVAGTAAGTGAGFAAPLIVGGAAVAAVAAAAAANEDGPSQPSTTTHH
ncbi:MAG TPA: FecR domain-containing protein [Burkholderiales bacterium]|nr:FecR domain-containing protein [Burkholderiales bacterium]